jgi:uncharacterized membrane protein
VGNNIFSFLKSNLFIGSLPPLIIAIFLKRYYLRLSVFFFWLVTLLWVLFYPNAPYMISDLIHNSSDPLNATHTQLIVFDTLIIFSIAMLSVFYGLLSLKIMFSIFKSKYNYKVAHLVIAITVILSCLGFYLGREVLSAIKLGNGYLYSWEIFIEPVQIFKSVAHLLFPVKTHKEAYAMMLLFGVIQYLLLIMFKDIGDIESEELFATGAKTLPSHS